MERPPVHSGSAAVLRVGRSAERLAAEELTRDRIRDSGLEHVAIVIATYPIASLWNVESAVSH